MTCHSIGRSPIIAMGFGPLWTPSRMRIPRPPQKSTTFMIPHFAQMISSSGDFEFGDREDQPSPPRPDVAELATYFLPQVPGQDEHVVGPGLRETLRCVDRNMGTGQGFALFHRGAVHRVGEQIRPDAAVVEERVALARSAVAGHGPALARRGEQEPEQVALDLQDRGRELLVTG